jgi:hypothetical protein
MLVIFDGHDEEIGAHISGRMDYGLTPNQALNLYQFI